MTRHYRGCIVRHFHKLGSPFAWESYVDGCGFIYADSLAGILQLIRESRP